MNQELLEKILDCPTLPTLPAVAVRVLELTQAKDVSMDDLAAAIQQDQALTAKVLKTVNSSFYGLRRPCANINQAIVMLGLSAVKSLALGFSLVTAVNVPSASEFDFVPYWRRGLYTAVAAKCISHEAGLATEDEAFLGGLLQDVGMIAMFQGLKRKYLEIVLRADADHRSLIRLELSELELQHPEVGAMLCERWKLPLELLMPVRFHERPTAAPQEYADLVRAVGLGNIAHDVLTDPDPGPAFKRFQTRAVQWFDFDEQTCDNLISLIAQGAGQVAPLFNLATGAAADPKAILERARAALQTLEKQAEQEQSHGASLNTLVSDSDQYDALTGAWSARAILKHADTAFLTAQEKKRSLTVLVFGLDGFKELVQRSGSEPADSVLVEAYLFLQEQIEPLGGLICRWESATYCIVLPGVDRAEAARIAAELKTALSHCSGEWEIGSAKWAGITASIGSATKETRDKAFLKVEQLISAAARAMEAATSGGGNCVRSFVPRRAA